MKLLQNKRHSFPLGALIRPLALGPGACCYIVLHWNPYRCPSFRKGCNGPCPGERPTLKCLNLAETPPSEYCITPTLGWSKIPKSQLPPFLKKEYNRWIKKVKI